MSKPLESHVENATRSHILDWAMDMDITLLFMKLNMLGSIGWPDRIILWQGGHVLFVEFKRPGEKPRRIQKHIHKILTDMGFIVQVHDDVNVAVDTIKKAVLASIRAGQGH